MPGAWDDPTQGTDAECLARQVRESFVGHNELPPNPYFRPDTDDESPDEDDPWQPPAPKVVKKAKQRAANGTRVQDDGRNLAATEAGAGLGVSGGALAGPSAALLEVPSKQRARTARTLPLPPPRPAEPVDADPPPVALPKRALAPVPAPPPRPVQAPDPAPARPIKRSKTDHPATSRPPSHSVSNSSIEVLEPVNVPAVAPTLKKRTSTSRSAQLKKTATAPAFASTSAAPAPAAKAKGGKKKGRKSVEVVLMDTVKLNIEKLGKEFPTISCYVNHLAAHEFDQPEKTSQLPHLFDGVRVAFVNSLIPKHPNQIDVSAAGNMARMLKYGATLVRPEEFVAAPLDAITPDDDADSIAQKAAAGGWTTHIIPLEYTSPKVVPKFASIYPCLGAAGIAGRDALGEFVKVVHYSWASDSILRSARDPEFLHQLSDDPRTPAAPVSKGKRDVVVISPRKKKKDTTPDTDDEASDGEPGVSKHGGSKHGGEREISPFGPWDYPQNEEPPNNYFGDPMDVDPLDPSSDPIVDTTFAPPPRVAGAFGGLEDEMRLIEKCDGVDLDAVLLLQDADDEKPDDDRILSTKEDDNETDDEDDPPEKFAAPPKAKKPVGAQYACEVSSTGGKRGQGPNEAVASVLEALGKHVVNGQWRERGYRKAAGALRNHPHAVTKYSEAVAIRFVGHKIAQKVVEIVRTGTFRRLAYTSKRDDVIKLFKGVYGVGPKIAEDFYDRSCRSLADLASQPLTESQRLGLKYYDDLANRIPRDEVTQLFDIAAKAANELDPKLRVMCMGSYRRGAADCGDIDLLITRDPSGDGKDHSGQIHKLQKKLFEAGMMQHALTSPEDWNSLDVKFNGLCRLPAGGRMRRIDILGVPWDELPAALIYFTGNDFFNRSLRLKARHLGFRLNQRGLFKDVSRDQNGLKLTEGTRVNCPTEQDIFRKLGVSWRPPEERIP